MSSYSEGYEDAAQEIAELESVIDRLRGFLRRIVEEEWDDLDPDDRMPANDERMVRRQAKKLLEAG